MASAMELNMLPVVRTSVTYMCIDCRKYWGALVHSIGGQGSGRMSAVGLAPFLQAATLIQGATCVKLLKF